MKKVLFILATHGDEYFSIEVFNKIGKYFPKDKYGYEWIIGNEIALKEKIRLTQSDLNRSAPGNLQSNIYEEKRAAEIMQMSKKYTCIIDIHGSVSQSGIVTIIPKPTIENIILAGLLPIKRNVIWYTKESLRKGPIVQFCKCPAIEIECGPKNSKDIQKKLFKIIEQILCNSKNISFKNMADNIVKKNFYKIYGKQNMDKNIYKDFQKIEVNGEQFIPFLANQYEKVACYKMKKIDIIDSFIY